ncbi:MAG: preprotein translocase subunit YajC [Thermodesulfovibrionales bacterium]|nr:preprotein translocase subunit YajC [Thermodesulfovibrionales bacterium]
MFSFYSLVTDVYAMGAPPQNTAQTGGVEGFIMSILPLVLIFVVFYLLLIRPQQKKAKEHRQMIDNLKKGDKVITTGGIYGVIDAVGSETFTVKIAENVKVKIGKHHIISQRSASDED